MRRLQRDRAQRVDGYDLEDADLGDVGAIQALLTAAGPSLVINAAAYTDVDGCESNEELAGRVNGDGPRFVADWCQEHDATLVHIGTDFVFDGTASEPYRPEDRANPISAYGRSKWRGEVGVRESGCRHLIVRTSWMFGPSGRNFVDRIIEKASDGAALRVVDDQVGRPTFSEDLADAIVGLLHADAAGTVHFANDGSCTWYELACAALRSSGIEVPVEAIGASELGLPAARPPYSVLDLTLYSEITGIAPPHWRDALTRYLAIRCARVAAE